MPGQTRRTGRLPLKLEGCALLLSETNAPLYTALCRQAESGPLRMHMPGHKGRAPEGGPLPDAAYFFDMTELTDTGDLFAPAPGDPIAKSEVLWANAVSAGGCIYCAGGSTQGLQAAIGALCRGGLLMDRNSHRSAYNALALFGLMPVYLPNSCAEGFSFPAPPKAEQVDAALLARPDLKTVLITSPNYYGAMADVSAIAGVCRAHGARLIVDQAHGAHLSFTGGRNAVAEGATAAVCSAHKTLPALGMSAMLFYAEGEDGEAIRAMCSVVGSSSPSYLLMLSMELARVYMEQGGAERYKETAAAVSALRREINEKTPFLAPEDGAALRLDPCRLTVCTAAGGLDGREAARLLREGYGAAAEMSDRENVVFILTCSDSAEDVRSLRRGLFELADGRSAVPMPDFLPPPEPVVALSPREALLSPTERVPLKDAAGRVAASMAAPYPPGVPVIAPGEEITQKNLAYLVKRSYNTNEAISIVSGAPV